MKYLKYADIKTYRQKNKPNICPILCINSEFVLDHDHITGSVRGVISDEANLILGKLDNAIRRYGSTSSLNTVQIIKNILDYYLRESTGILHPVGAKQLCTSFRRLRKNEQNEYLLNLNIDISEIKACINNKDREKLFRKALTNNPLDI